LDLSGDDLDNVTRTIMAEAGENATPASIAAVASVIRNRLAAGGYGRTPSEIVHAPYQFSPWNPNPGNDPSRFPADSPGI
jgi:spore germination cell wall hydrolase CwlJ-like protein